MSYEEWLEYEQYFSVILIENGHILLRCTHSTNMSKDYQLTVSEYDKYSYVMNLSKQNVCLYKFHIINSHIHKLAIFQIYIQFLLIHVDNQHILQQIWKHLKTVSWKQLTVKLQHYIKTTNDIKYLRERWDNSYGLKELKEQHITYNMFHLPSVSTLKKQHISHKAFQLPSVPTIK